MNRLTRILRKLFACELLPALAIMAMLAMSSIVDATICDWQGDESTLYSTAGNWDNAPSAPTTDTLNFDATAAAACSLDAVASARLWVFDGAFDEDLNCNPANACTTINGVSFDGTGNTIRLNNTWVQTGDGDYALEAGPTYAINALSFDTDLQGTGNLVIGGTTTIHKLSCAAAGKVTTKSSAGTLNLQQLTLGAGEFAVAVSQVIVKAKATSDYSFNASHSITGAGQLQLQVNAVVDLVLPLVNASGHSGVLVLGGASTGTHSMTLGGALNNGGITRIRKTGTGVFTFGTGNYNIASAGSFEIVSRSAVGSYTANLGSSTIDLATDWDNSSSALGGVTINAQTATIQIGDDFTLDTTHNTWVAGTETITADGSGAQAITSAGQTIYDLEIDNSAGLVTFTDKASVNDLTVTDGAVTFAAGLDYDGDALFDCDDAVILPADTVRGTGASGELHIGSTVASVSAASTTLQFDGTTGMVLDDDKTSTFKGLVLGTNAVLTNSGASYSSYSGTAPLLTLGDGCTFTSNSTLIYILTGAGALVSVGGTHTFNGSGQNSFRVSGVAATLPAITYTGSREMVFISASTPSSLTLTGSLDIGASRLEVWANEAHTYAFDTDGNDVTCGIIRTGAGANGATFTFGCGASTINCASLETTTKNSTSSTIDAESSVWNVVGNVAIGTNTTVVPGTSAWTITGASTLTSAGEQWADSLCINSSGTASTVGNWFARAFRLATGGFDMSADTGNVTDIHGAGGDMIYDATSLLRIKDGGSVTGFDGDTLPKTIWLGDGGF